MGTPELIGCQALPSVGFSKNARILEQLARSFSKDLPEPGIELAFPATAGEFFITSITWEAQFNL